MSRWLHNALLAALIALFVFSTTRVGAQETNYKAYTLCVYNFMKYIEWPSSKTAGTFVVGVLGDSPIYSELKAMAAMKKLKGREIEVRIISSADEASACHLVYIVDHKSSMMKELISALGDKPVLLVGEREGLVRKGAGVSFVTLENDQLRFDINKTGIENNRMKVPTSLINLSERVI